MWRGDPLGIEVWDFMFDDYWGFALCDSGFEAVVDGFWSLLGSHEVNASSGNRSPLNPIP